MNGHRRQEVREIMYEAACNFGGLYTSAHNTGVWRQFASKKLNFERRVGINRKDFAIEYIHHGLRFLGNLENPTGEDINQ